MSHRVRGGCSLPLGPIWSSKGHYVSLLSSLNKTSRFHFGPKFCLDYDELENNLGSSFPIMTIKASITHLSHALMMKRNGRKTGNK